ncbi:6321_t:CDS:1, partial [Funneliformis caledonium]
LLIKVPVVDGYIWRPKMLYLIPCLKTQISTMYKRPGFEQLLRKWVDRDVGPG